MTALRLGSRASRLDPPSADARGSRAYFIAADERVLLRWQCGLRRWSLRLIQQMPVDHSRSIVLLSGSPLKYLFSIARNIDSLGAALMNSVMDDRSFMASIAPKISVAPFPLIPIIICVHMVKPAPRIGCRR